MRQLKYYLKYIRSYFPETVPVGMTAFNRFLDDIVELAGPIADIDSMKYVISTTLIHLPQEQSVVTKQLFVRRLRKAAANQIASAVFQEIQKNAQAKKQAEATATELKAVANGEKTNC